MVQIIYNDLGRSKDFVAAAVATLGDFEHDMIGLAWVMPHGNSLVPVGIEGPPNVLDGLDTVTLEQQAQLLQRHFHTLMQWLGGNGLLGSQGAFEIVENGQQVADEGFFFSRGLSLGISPGALFEVVEVRGEAQVIVLLCGQILKEYDWIGRRRISDGSGRILRIGRWTRRIGIHGLPLVALYYNPWFFHGVHGNAAVLYFGASARAFHDFMTMGSPLRA